jgi:N6-L-threonylcarbamoyladenine synthase
VALTVSGGHTQLILMKDIGKYKILGETRDDAAGECFDKTARILGLPYPGGPAIAQLAKKLKQKTNINKYTFAETSFHLTPRFSTSPPDELLIKLPRPMMYQKNYDFSFSGLKTAVLYHWQKQPAKIRKSKEYVKAMAFEIQQAIIDVLIHKTIKAVKEYKAKTIILGGGVAANEELRKQFKSVIIKQRLKINFLVPPKNLCTDNGAMIAAAGYYQWLKNKTKKWNMKADANLRLGVLK